MLLPHLNAPSCWASIIPSPQQNSRKNTSNIRDQLEGDPQSARLLLNNDFEDGLADPWYDSSLGPVHWTVEDFSSPTEINYPPPTPSTGTKYLRATRDAQLSPGLLVLRTVTFTALPGDRISFNFWIRSKYTFGNTLELVLVVGDAETTLLTLSSYSTTVNFEWRPASTSIPVTSPTDLTLIFYANCGSNAEDAVAIDDIVLVSTQGSTTDGITASIISTTSMPPTRATPEPKNCPAFLPGTTAVPCVTLGTGCYCISDRTSGYLDWADADAICRKGNMTLVSLETEGEESLIYKYWQVTPELGAEQYWTSGKFPLKGSQRTWEWAATEPYQRFNYTNWGPDEPDYNQDGYCAYLFMDFDFENGYFWIDIACSSSLYNFICEL
ncbi:uncharacterized protein LOC130694505 isoform X3 [Daphnia carinata]|uniref:uncharacterized protein LOC130694505 isoform X3 n=1 Tax=Daphnia carinata TaxID=120202 RepID=UPI0025807F60|nr:uncharacterized protein LOC130694505 isoform X3 [Daphnia carinata]XP_059351133.1 uncharacterized protein LOC130694505 isoform X3 [Daphnia carinata]